MIGITLVDDLAFVVMTILLPALTTMTATSFYSLGVAFGKALLILVPAGIVAVKVVPRLMAAVVRIGSQELSVLVALGLGLPRQPRPMLWVCRWRWVRFSRAWSSVTPPLPERRWGICFRSAMPLWPCFSLLLGRSSIQAPCSRTCRRCLRFWGWWFSESS